MEIDFEFEKLFPKDHPETLTYQQHVEEFGYDNDYLQIILRAEEGIFNRSFLTRSIAFEKSLGKLDGVRRVYSPLSLQHVVKSPTGIVIFPLISEKETSEYQMRQDSLRIFSNPFYRSAFSKDGKALAIYINHVHFDNVDSGDKLIDQIKQKALLSGITDYLIIGKIPASSVFISYIRNDFSYFLLASLGLSFVLLLILFRDIKAALLPFLISLLSLIWLFGLMGLLGIKINLLSSLLPPILLFVSMSDAVHLMNAYSRINETHPSKRILATVDKIWVPTLLTSITTAIGFLSLLWINTEPVQILGTFAAIGILIAFLQTFTVGIWVLDTTKPRIKAPYLKLTSSWGEMIFGQKKAITFGIILTIAAVIPGLLKLDVDAYLLEDLPPNAEIVKDFQTVDQTFGGSKPYEIRIALADTTKSIWDGLVMDQILKIENYMNEKYPVARVQSPVTIIKYLHMVNNGGLNEYYKYPESDRSYEATIRLKNRIDPKRMDKLVTEDGKVARLIGFIPELGSKETESRNQKLKDYLSQVVDTSLIKYSITGTTHLIDKSHQLLSENLFKGLFTAIGVIGVILGLYFRSWKLLIISILPNLIPLLVIAGIIGYAGISLKLTTSIIFTVAFGIAVDDTIHLMSHYLQNRKTQEPKDAMNNALKYAGGAMLITTITMVAGFGLYLFSSFGATFYMGLFVCLSLILALVIDLTFLPHLLITYHKKNAKNRR